MARTVPVTLTANVSGFTAGMQTAASSVDALDKRVSAVQKNSANISKLGTGFLAFGAAAVAGAGMMVKGYADFDAAMSNVKATGADAAQNIDKLTTAAMEAGRSFGQFSATDAADGIEQLAKAGLSATDILEGGLTGALSLAAAGEMAVGDAAEVTAKTLAQFQLAGEDASHVADLLAAGAGKAVGDVSDLGQALAQSGTVANQYGISVEETVGTLSLFAQNALLGSDAGTSLKSMLLQLASPTGEARKQMAELGISAYDTQGQFVGMAGLADQLKTKLGGLSQEQQNAALKTIFGADAIRSASILMREGGDAVRQWTADVDDQGYAAMVAATKMDNLKGDLAELGGSWETLTIKMGSAGNSPLRPAVQSVTDLVDRIGEAPPAMQAFALGSMAVVGGGALIAGGLAKGIVAFSETRAAVKDLSEAFPKLSGAMKGVGLAAGALAVAVVAIKALDSITYKPLTKGLTESTTAMLSMAQASKGLSGSLNGVAIQASYSTKALDDFFRKEDGGELVYRVGGVGDAFRRLNPELKSAGLKFKDWYQSGVHVTGISTEVSRLVDGFGEMDKALSTMATNGSMDQAAGAFTIIAAEAKKAGTSTDDLIKLFPTYHAHLQSQANALEQQTTGFSAASLTAQDYADWMGGKVPASVMAAATAAKAAGKDVGTLADANTTAAETAKLAAQTAEDQFNAYQALANQALAASSSEMGLYAAIDAATKAAKENGKTLDSTGKALDITTEKGRANRSALDGIAAATLKVVEDQRKQGASSAELTAITNQGRQAFIEQARSMGLAKGEAQKLWDKLGQGPKNVSIPFSTPGIQASKRQVADLTAKIQALPPEKAAIVRSTWDSAGYYAAMTALSRIDGNTAHTYVVTEYISRTKSSGPGGPNVANANGSIMDYYADGGVREHHVAQIAPAGAWRVWAEPETGGEAYIPFAASKRGRSRQIAEETVRRLGGGGVEWYASGGLTKGQIAATASNGTISKLMAAYQMPTAQILAAAAALSKLKASAAGVTATANRAQAVTNRAKRTRDADKTRVDRAKDTRDRNVKAANRKVDAAKTARDKRLAKLKAKGASSKTLSKARDQEAAKVKAAQAAAKRVADREAARVKAAEAKAKKSSAAYTSALDKSRAAQDKAKAAQEKASDAAKVMAERQKALADTARQASESYRSLYDQGLDGADWIAQMKRGTSDLASFASQIGKLRKAGLSETLIQEILGRGVQDGSYLADQILKGGSSIVKALNATSKGLQAQADKLGLAGAIGVKQYASGGIEDHRAQITAAGSPVRIWSEPETGGESYIPLAASKRARSIPIWLETGRRLGVAGYASGAVLGGRPQHMPTLDPNVIATAVAGALVGMAVVLDNQRVGQIVDSRIRRSDMAGSFAAKQRLGGI